MILKGLLGSFTVVDVFQFLALAKVTGLLIIDTVNDRAWIYFHKGELIYARRQGPTERLGDRLLRLGIISESQLAGVDLRNNLESGKKRIGQILVDAGSLDQESLQKVVRNQIQEVVTDIIAFESGEFRFYEDRLPHEEDILLDVSLDLLLLEGMKRLDEIRMPHRNADDPEGEPV
ncbi:MAG: DUF4388 domain-containing protein [bacterium]